jgi:hypothetical protein
MDVDLVKRNKGEDRTILDYLELPDAMGAFLSEKRTTRCNAGL